MLNTAQIRLLCNFLETTERVSDVNLVISKYPEVLDHYTMQYQIHPAIVSAILSHGYLPPESYLYHVCDHEYVDIIAILCENNIFRKVVGDDEDAISLYAGKPLAAQILLQNGCISQDTYRAYVPIWT